MEVNSMRKVVIISLILITCMLIGSVVYAHFPGGYGSCIWKQDNDGERPSMPGETLTVKGTIEGHRNLFDK
jgi:hypothetical protein